MLTETDPRVLAEINLRAVLGALPRLVDLAPDARTLLAGLDRPVTLTFTVLGGSTARFRFARDGITAAPAPGAPGTSARLLLRSPAHLNAVIDGTSQPVPVAGPAGLRFLTGTFTPLSALLSRYLQPSDADLADEAFAAASRELVVHVAVAALVVVANEDRAGRFSAGQMPDGDLDVEAGDDLRYRVRITGHRLRLVPVDGTPARATFRFADLVTAGDVLAGRESALACVGDGRIALSGYIPLVDNASRVLDRVGQYL
ncbi:hypothetical protein [Cellulomonas triticagri]|uniref:SCP2 domain-containing protein n=1 Tax=Cellulomonas triticagri TaxID=2483352 RepID=A0A3M2JKS3_9CELL|nr:hypothetical protein [Cellulomonas triticagri]RMI14442.1 hypothetical protein EBM89_00255 [Cellulomonas triticagri]